MAKTNTKLKLSLSFELLEYLIECSIIELESPTNLEIQEYVNKEYLAGTEREITLKDVTNYKLLKIEKEDFEYESRKQEYSFRVGTLYD